MLMSEHEDIFKRLLGEDFADKFLEQPPLSLPSEPIEPVKVSEWIIEPLPRGQNELERFRTVYGGSRVSLDWVLLSHVMKLNWQAKLESYMRPGMTVSEFDRDFLPALFYTIPSRMGLTEGLEKNSSEIEDKFRLKSQVTVKYYEGGDESYNLRTRGGLIGLATDMIGNKNPISSLRVIAGERPGRFDYDLKIGYGVNIDPVEFNLPINQKGLKAANGNFAELMLMTNTFKGDLEAPGLAASRLGLLMYRKMREVLARG